MATSNSKLIPPILLADRAGCQAASPPASISATMFAADR
jgi:hypothetical protein